MRKGLFSMLLVALTVVVHPAQGELQLVAGMELTYSSGDVASPPWRVLSVERDVALGGRTGCLRVQFAPGGPREGLDIRVTCEEDGMLFAWDSTRSTWRASRPIRTGGTLDTRVGSNTARYVAGATAVDTIGRHLVRVIETTMVTSDSTLTPRRRLRERYAPSLGTATSGVFERPDPAAATGWAMVQEFRIVGIKLP